MVNKLFYDVFAGNFHSLYGLGTSLCKLLLTERKKRYFPTDYSK